MISMLNVWHLARRQAPLLSLARHGLRRAGLEHGGQGIGKTGESEVVAVPGTTVMAAGTTATSSGRLADERADDQHAAAAILARAADTAPAELALPDGCRIRPQADDLDRQCRLLPPTGPPTKAHRLDCRLARQSIRSSPMPAALARAPGASGRAARWVLVLTTME